MAQTLGKFKECKKNGKDRIGKHVKRVFVMLGVCELLDSCFVRRLKPQAADLSNAFWAYHREIVWICVPNAQQLNRSREREIIKFNAF